MLNFKPRHDCLIAIDSDGCVFDTMEIKHKECFIPEFIRWFKLQAISKYARETAEQVNLYSATRGLNRFPGYIATLDKLAERPEAVARGYRRPELPALREWVRTETKLSTGTSRAAADRTGAPDLQVAANWSAAVDATIKSLVHGVPPFPGVRECFELLQGRADVIVCSATPTPALIQEWEEHGIAQFTAQICGQEMGSKREILTAAVALGYSPDKILMMGDSPGDLNAARAVGAHFQPIVPGREEASWAQFNATGLNAFLNGTFGALEADLERDYASALGL